MTKDHSKLKLGNYNGHVCLSVCQKMFHNVLKCSRMFQNVLECSIRFHNVLDIVGDGGGCVNLFEVV